MNDQPEDLKPAENVRSLPSLNINQTTGIIIPENTDQAKALAQYMAKGRENVPKHLRDNPAMCMTVVMDASNWKLNPFRLATMHMVVNGIGAYMAQALMAAINQNVVIKGRLVPRYEGEGDSMRCILEPVTAEGQVLPYESPMVKDITPRNSPLWKVDPRQQLFYFSSRAWARRYFPEVLMGAYAVDEAREMKDITPQPVDNFLNDEEPPKREAGPGTDNRFYRAPDEMPMIVSEADLAAIDKVDLRPGPVRQEASPEPTLFAEAVDLTPELVAINLEKGVAGCMTKGDLDAFTAENAKAIAELPEPLRRRVRKVAADRFFDLDEA